MTPRSYVAVVVAGSAAVLLLTAAANTAISLAGYRNESPAAKAASWQRDTRGIVAFPPNASKEFKLRRIAAVAPTIRTAVFGSSRIMALGSRQTGPDSYNFAINNESLFHSIAFANELLRTAPNLRTVYVSVDWALGDAFAADAVPAIELPGREPMGPLLLSSLGDSLTLPRVRLLAGTAFEDLIGNNRPPSLPLLLFYGHPPAVEQCADGLQYANFGFDQSLPCHGFFDDGSVTFDWLAALTPATAQAQRLQALAASSQYLQNLNRTNGTPNRGLLQALAALHRRLVERGGGVIALVPPMMPDLEKDILALPVAGPQLRQFHAAMKEWAAENRIRLLDFGASDRFGCVTREFIDAHHAKPDCWTRLFKQAG